MTTRSDGWARLTAAVEEHGEQWVLDSVVSRIAEGENPREIAVSQGYPWYVLRRWLEDSPSRMQAWELGKRCAADRLLYEGLRVARDATVEGVQVSKLQVDTYSKVAGKMNREEWGEKVQMDVRAVHSVDIRALLEAREARLMAIEPQVEPVRLPVVVEQEEMQEERVL